MVYHIFCAFTFAFFFNEFGFGLVHCYFIDEFGGGIVKHSFNRILWIFCGFEPPLNDCIPKMIHSLEIIFVVVDWAITMSRQQEILIIVFSIFNWRFVFEPNQFDFTNRLYYFVIPHNSRFYIWFPQLIRLFNFLCTEMCDSQTKAIFWICVYFFVFALIHY